jgi:c-di-GMP-binding flagellar brake protein YcgR
MEEYLMKINQTLYLQVASLDETNAMSEYKARIADISTDEVKFEIPIDVKTGKLKRLRLNEQISGYYLTDNGVKNVFTSEVIGFDSDIVNLVIIRRPPEDNIQREQRRSFLRVPASLEIALKKQDDSRFTALTLDISGGGVSLSCSHNDKIVISEQFSCWLLIKYKNGWIEHVPFKSEVVRVISNEKGKQIVMMRFIEIMGFEQQKIMKYCFERQFDMRK